MHAQTYTRAHAHTHALRHVRTLTRADARGCAQVTRFLCAARPGIGTRLLIAASPLTGGGIGAVGGERAPLRKRLRAVGADFVAGWVRTGTLRAVRRIRPTPAFAPACPCVCLFAVVGVRSGCPLPLARTLGAVPRRTRCSLPLPLQAATAAPSGSARSSTRCACCCGSCWRTGRRWAARPRRCCPCSSRCVGGRVA